MKKYTATYLLLSIALLLSGCMEDGSEEFTINPYVALRSFGISSVNVYSTTQLSNGNDTTLVSLVNGTLYPFVIDQKSRMVYNPDSLPYGSDLTKLLINVSSDGIAYLYNDSTEIYDPVSSSDSLDFSRPRKLLVAAMGAPYAQEYSVTVNAHKADPNKLFWEKLPASPIEKPLRLLMLDGTMMLFGNNADGVLLVTKAQEDNSAVWGDVNEITTLPATADVDAMLSFNGLLYATADGALYSSVDGVEWNKQDAAVSTLLVASQQDARLWAVCNGDIAYSTDGVTFTAMQKLPEGFPVYNISATTYPLATNPFITRYMLIGYPSQEAATPVVWSKLSTEDKWVQYEYLGDGSFDCPALSPLSVLRYDGRLFAFGGAGTLAGNELKAFEYMYISSDNGLSWHLSTGSNLQMPKELLGSTAPYATAVDNENRIWIVSGDTQPLWRGCINRLSSK